MQHKSLVGSIVPILIEADGARVAVRRYGVGPVVVCLHATGHGARDFDRLALRLGASFEFVAIDWPGQGDSPREEKPASAARYAEILESTVDHLNLGRFLLLGNSIGGAAAIIYSEKHPERVRGVVLCNSGGLIATNIFVRFYCRKMAHRFERGARGDRSFPNWFGNYYRSILPSPEAEWRRSEIAAEGPHVAAVLSEAWRSFAEPEADIRDLVANLRAPVLYAWGRRDRTLPWSWVRPAARRTPCSEVVLFDAGHAAFLEQPDLFDAAFRGFAERAPV